MPPGGRGSIKESAISRVSTVLLTREKIPGPQHPGLFELALERVEPRRVTIEPAAEFQERDDRRHGKEREPAPREALFARSDEARARIEALPDPDHKHRHLGAKHDPADAAGHPHAADPFRRNRNVI